MAESRNYSARRRRLYEQQDIVGPLNCRAIRRLPSMALLALKFPKPATDAGFLICQPDA